MKLGVWTTVLVGFPAVVFTSDLPETVLRSRDLAELKQKMRRHDYGAADVERVPDKLFQHILKDQMADAEWKALDHYSKLMDAGTSLEFFRSCYAALVQQPLIFYRRYMSGDATALDRMVDALTYDFAAYERLTSDRIREYEQRYDQILSRISQERRGLSGEQVQRHDTFVRSAQRQLEQWRIRYKR